MHGRRWLALVLAIKSLIDPAKNHQFLWMALFISINRWLALDMRHQDNAKAQPNGRLENHKAR